MEKELKIGETGVIDGIRVICLEDTGDGCYDCVFYDGDFCDGKAKMCKRYGKRYGKSVYFKEL